MCANRLFLAAAGSGKTSLIVNEVLQESDTRILITTFTLENERSIRSRLINANNGVVPSNVTIQPWFSFLLEHGVRPYRFWGKRVNGMQLVQSMSGVRYINPNGTPVQWTEKDNFQNHYFNDNMDVYSDKLSKLVVRCNEKSAGKVISRLEAIFGKIYIDEVQDMAGWDLEIIKMMLKSRAELTMVGDPRQVVYLTHNERKYKKYKDGKIQDFINEKCNDICLIDNLSLRHSYRNSTDICKLASSLYPDLAESQSQLEQTDDHMGIFFVRESDLQEYGARYFPLQLRYDKRKESILMFCRTMTFGSAKGLEADHVIIYPTSDMLKWLNGENVTLSNATKARLYVALTRAFYSVGIVVEDSFSSNADSISIWESA